MITFKYQKDDADIAQKSKYTLPDSGCHPTVFHGTYCSVNFDSCDVSVIFMICKT